MSHENATNNLILSYVLRVFSRFPNHPMTVEELVAELRKIPAAPKTTVKAVSDIMRRVVNHEAWTYDEGQIMNTGQAREIWKFRNGHTGCVYRPRYGYFVWDTKARRRNDGLFMNNQFPVWYKDEDLRQDAMIEPDRPQRLFDRVEEVKAKQPVQEHVTAEPVTQPGEYKQFQCPECEGWFDSLDEVYHHAQMWHDITTDDVDEAGDRREIEVMVADETIAVPRLPDPTIYEQLARSADILILLSDEGEIVVTQIQSTHETKDHK